MWRHKSLLKNNVALQSWNSSLDSSYITTCKDIVRVDLTHLRISIACIHKMHIHQFSSFFQHNFKAYFRACV